MNQLDLHIDQVTVETAAEASQLRDASPKIKEAFQLLAVRLEKTPFAQWGEGRAAALEQLSVEMAPAEELFGPRGAEYLADKLYLQLLRRMG